MYKAITWYLFNGQNKTHKMNRKKRGEGMEARKRGEEKSNTTNHREQIVWPSENSPRPDTQSFKNTRSEPQWLLCSCCIIYFRCDIGFITSCVTNTLLSISQVFPKYLESKCISSHILYKIAVLDCIFEPYAFIWSFKISTWSSAD